MIMTPRLRKFILIIHVTASVGWIGSVLAYLTLVFAAMNRYDNQILSASWIGMELIGLFVIVPLSLASLITGLVMALGTKWGLFRHYWVLFSLGLTILATAVLLVHMQTVSFFATITIDMNSTNISRLRDGLQGELLHAGVGLVVLLVVQVLNVYKPRGITPYGWRIQYGQSKPTMLSPSKENLEA